MRLLDLTLPTPEENLALDEALLLAAECDADDPESLRLWESPTPFVVLGRASRVQEEVDNDACQRLELPILRRHSGGAAVVAGPGCLMYALVLSCRKRPHLRSIAAAHAEVLETIVAALKPAAPALSRRGTSDLVVGDRKVSGNSLRCRSDHVLYHGTLLYDFSIRQVGNVLHAPPRQPAYRDERNHEDFMANLDIPPLILRQTLAAAFAANQPVAAWPSEAVEKLVREKYATTAWNHGR